MRSMRGLSIVLAGALLLTAAPAPPASACTWAVVASPNRGYDPNELNDVAVVSAKEAWAVGQSDGFPNKLLALHWTGSSWKVTKIPKPKSTNNVWLNGVAAIAPDDVWAVGMYLDGSVVRPLIRHWDGSGWKMAKPPVGVAKGELRAVAAGPGGEVWAVGLVGSESLIIRWDGTRWAKVAHPDPGSQATALNDITRVPGTHKLWAVGSAADLANTLPLMMLWSGKKWIHKTGPFANDGVLNGVSALAPDGVWVVGTEQGFNYSIYLTEYWDGSTWYKVTPSGPSAQFPGNILNEVAVLSGSSAVAVGFYAPGTPSYPVVLNWGGFAWSATSTPAQTSARFNAIARVPGSAKLWAVGATWDGARDTTLTERCA